MNNNSLIYKAKRLAGLYRVVYLQKRTPILVYTVGRVGSNSIYFSLLERGIPAYHLHFLRPEKMPNVDGTTRWLFSHVIQKQRAAKLIMMVRDPAGQVISDFFPSLTKMTSLSDIHKTASVDELLELFHTHYFQQGRHLTKLNWFSEEVQPALGFDALAHPFPREQGYATYAHGPFDILILKTELDDAQKSIVVGEFVGVPSLKIGRVNTAENKPHQAKYAEFKQKLQFTAEELAVLYESAYVQHFYSPAMIQAMRAQWQ